MIDHAIEDARTRPHAELVQCERGPAGEPCAACRAALDELEAMSTARDPSAEGSGRPWIVRKACHGCGGWWSRVMVGRPSNYCPDCRHRAHHA